jgi:SAM-dependent methyltransferase
MSTARLEDPFTSFERAGWDRIGLDYDRFLGPVTAAAAGPLLDAAEVGQGSRVLDVATGPGYVAGAAVGRGARTVAVDLSSEILALARARHPGPTYRVADAAALPFDDGSFDAVVAGFLLPHLADHGRAVAECRRVLVGGGMVALSTWAQPARVPGLGMVAAAVAEVGAQPPAGLPAGPPFFAYSDPAALVALLSGAGLADVGVTLHGFEQRVPSAAALWEGVLAGTVRTAALVTAQPAETQVAIRAAFDRLVEPYVREGGEVVLPVSVLVAAGRRSR